LDEQGLFGDSFFISRDLPERREAPNILCSIGHQLAVRWRPVSDALCAKLHETPISATRSLKQQITNLIIVSDRASPVKSFFVIVIDALHEPFTGLLGRSGGDLLFLLGRLLLQTNGRVKLFITCRNEVPIQQMFHQLSAISQTVVKLHDLDGVVMRDEIAIYFIHSFAVIRMTRQDLALTDWPNTEAVNTLAGRSTFYQPQCRRLVGDLFGQFKSFLLPNLHKGRAGNSTRHIKHR
jgi:hypothetical protein